MTGTFLNEERTAELWERVKKEIASQPDRQGTATDEEVEEMLDEVLGPISMNNKNGG
ncbi:MAG: hypothetical protein K2N78_12590 [Oscillospiraceae bacterium]|nr:hypothetical protein [Oscillospiraceae bacterium]